MLKIEVVNPDQKTWYGKPSAYHREQGAYLFTFGAYGSTHLLVYGDSLESALEEAAGWLADNAPGHIMPEGDEYLNELREEACEEAGLTWPPKWSELTPEEQSKYWVAFENAEADLTYTESGYLTSYEWGVSGPLTPKQIANIAHQR